MAEYRKEKYLICGSRSKKDYKDVVFKQLNKLLKSYRTYIDDWKPECIIEGECEDSADIYSKEWAKENNIEVKPFPSEKGKYLKRNIEMVKLADEVIAFWDGFSYGTAHTVAQAILHSKPVTLIKISKGLHKGKI